MVNSEWNGDNRVRLGFEGSFLYGFEASTEYDNVTNESKFGGVLYYEGLGAWIP